MVKRHDLNGTENAEKARTEENGGIIKVFEDEFTKVRRLEPEDWIYEIGGYGPYKDSSGEIHDEKVQGFALLGFQWGAIETEGVNGITVSDLLAIAADRLENQIGSSGGTNLNWSKALDSCRLALAALKGDG